MINCPHCGNETEPNDMRDGVCLDCYMRIHSADMQDIKSMMRKKKRRKPASGENDAFACFGVDLK